MPLIGAYNTRDLGGYPISQNKMTKWGVFLRSADLTNINDIDRRLLYDYGIKTAIDLRCDFEVKNINHFDQKYITYKNIPLMDNYENITNNFYFHMIDNCKDNIKQIFDYIGERISYGGILYNCVLGRDRTGVISALLMLLCGVSDLDVIADYIVSSVYLKPFATSYNLVTEQISANADEIENFLNYLKNQYSGAEDYLLSINVSPEIIEKIRGNFIDIHEI